MGSFVVLVKLLVALVGFLHTVHLNDSLLIQVTARLNAAGGGSLTMDIGINNYAFDALSMIRDPLNGFRQAGLASGATVTPYGESGFKGWTMTNTFTSYAGLTNLENAPLYHGWCLAAANRMDGGGYHVHMVYDGAAFAPLDTRLRLSNLMTLRYRIAAPGTLTDGQPTSVNGRVASWLITMSSDRQVIDTHYSGASGSTVGGDTSMIAGILIAILVLSGSAAVIGRGRIRGGRPGAATTGQPLPVAAPPGATMTGRVAVGGTVQLVLCPGCQAPQPVSARYCNACGVQLQAALP